MSFLLRVAGDARATMPGIPVARPKGLLPNLPAAATPIGQAPPAPTPRAPRPAPSPIPRAAPQAARRQPPTPAPAAPLPPAQPPVEMSAPKDVRADPPLVVEWGAQPATAEESGAPAEPARATPPDAGHPERSVPAAVAAPAPELPDDQPSSRPVLEVALPHDAPQTRPPPGSGLDVRVGPPTLATHVPDDAGTTPNEPIARRDGALRVPPPQRGEGAPMAEAEAPAPAPADRPLEQADRRANEVLPIARPLISRPPPPPTERALQRPAAETKPPQLQIDQIDVVVTDPAPAPPARARPFAAVAANRRYLRRL